MLEVPTFDESDVAALQTAFSDPKLGRFVLWLRVSSAFREPCVIEM